MSTDPARPSRALPQRPDLRHLKDQAKDLLKSGVVESLSEAQFKLAREYGFASWPKLKSHVESLQEAGQLKAAIDANDLDRVKTLMTNNPRLHEAPIGYKKNGPLTWAAECRGVQCSHERLAIARWMIENGSDVHQGGGGPLMRAALFDERIPMMELLVEHGADVNSRWDDRYPVILAPCETLEAKALAWLIAHGADPHVVDSESGSCAQMLVSTYSREPEGKHACLEVIAEAGVPLPDTAPMAIHRGRIDLLEACLERNPKLLGRHFAESEIYPIELGIKPGNGLHCTPVEGTTLLHLAVEYQELEIVRWLLAQGADVDAPAAVDSEGFGGQSPLFHAAVTIGGHGGAQVARLLMEHGANPNARATFRKQLRYMGDSKLEKMVEYHDTTPIDYANQFQVPGWADRAAIEVIAAYGGQ